MYLEELYPNSFLKVNIEVRLFINDMLSSSLFSQSKSIEIRAGNLFIGLSCTSLNKKNHIEKARSNRGWFNYILNNVLKNQDGLKERWLLYLGPEFTRLSRKDISNYNSFLTNDYTLIKKELSLNIEEWKIWSDATFYNKIISVSSVVFSYDLKEDEFMKTNYSAKDFKYLYQDLLTQTYSGYGCRY